MIVKEYKDKNIRKIYSKNDLNIFEKCPFSKWHPDLRSYNCLICNKRIRIDFIEDNKICVLTCKIHNQMELPKKINTAFTVIGFAVSAYEIMCNTFKWYERKYGKGSDKKNITRPIIKGR